MAQPEEEEEEIGTILDKARVEFMKISNCASKEQYRVILSVLGIQVADEAELEDYFNTIDYDEDGFVCYEDFEHNIMLNTEEEGPGTDMGDDQPVSLLTLEALAELRNLFRMHRRRHHARIAEMKASIMESGSGFALTTTDFAIFFREYLQEERISEDEFSELVNDYEAKLLGVAGIRP